MTDDHKDQYRSEGDDILMRILDANGHTVDWMKVATCRNNGLAHTLAVSANVGYRRMAEVFTDAMIDSVRGEGNE
jgi:hypothetical protein